MADFTTDGHTSTPLYENGRNEQETIAWLLANAGGETNQPTLVLETAEGPIVPAGTIVFHVEEDESFPVTMTIVAAYSDRTEAIIVYQALQGYVFAQQPYSANLQIDMGGGWDITVSHTGDGWPDDFTITAYVHDGEANLAQVSGSFTRNPPYVPPDPPEPPDNTPPEITNVSPPPGSPIAPGTPISFDVTDDSGSFRRVLVMVGYGAGPLAGVTELCWDGDAFVGHYAAGTCLRTPITDGFRFTVLRDGTGWPAGPILRAFAFDLSGNEA